MALLSEKVAELAVSARLAANFWYDYRRFARASFVTGKRNRENQRAMIYILFHSIEHGLSLSAPRPGFGQDKVASLLRKTKAYFAEFGADSSTASALRVLDAWVAFNRGVRVDVAKFADELDELNAATDFRNAAVSGGTEEVRATDLRQLSTEDFAAFMQARHSVRQFSERPVTAEEIEYATRTAQQAPSVCNRQTCRVYAFTGAEDKARVLSYQSGNRGFGQEIGAVLIVTSNMEHLNLIGERYQHWIDGGLFAMTLALAFHAKGMGACMLNWSVTKEIDQAMRGCVGIPENEAVITMMGVGHLKEVFRVPCSQRKPAELVLTLDPPLNRNAPSVTL